MYFLTLPHEFCTTIIRIALIQYQKQKCCCSSEKWSIYMQPSPSRSFCVMCVQRVSSPPLKGVLTFVLFGLIQSAIFPLGYRNLRTSTCLDSKSVASLREMTGCSTPSSKCTTFDFVFFKFTVVYGSTIRVVKHEKCSALRFFSVFIVWCFLRSITLHWHPKMRFYLNLATHMTCVNCCDQRHTRCSTATVIYQSATIVKISSVHGICLSVAYEALVEGGVMSRCLVCIDFPFFGWLVVLRPNWLSESWY